MSEELKNCPFCGQSAVKERWEWASFQDRMQKDYEESVKRLGGHVLIGKEEFERLKRALKSIAPEERDE